MRKYIYTFSICVSLFLGALIVSRPANASIKSDIEQAVAKITGWIQSMKRKCQEIIKGVQSSQFGQVVGKGIENTKKAIAFAKEGKEKILSSDEYKAVQVSAQIAKKTTELKNLSEEKLLKQQDVNSELELLKEQTVAKINLVQENLEIIETKGSDISDEEKASIEIEIENINNAYVSKEALLKDEFASIEDEYALRTDELINEIKELTQRLAELEKKFFDKQKEKREKKKTEEALNETYEEYTTQNAIVSIKEEEKIRTKRRKKIKETNSSILAETANKRDIIFESKDSVDKIERLSPTPPGEADVSVITGQVLSEQINALRKYIELTLADLEAQTTMEIGLWHDVTIPKMAEKFNLCNYAIKDLVGYKSYGSFDLDKLKQMQEKAKDTIEQGKELIDLSKETASSIIDTVQTGLDNQSSISLGSMH